MLYEIISPDAFMRPYIDRYATLSGIFNVVRNAYARKVYVDRAFQKKTNELVQQHIGTGELPKVDDFVAMTPETIELIKAQQGGDGKKVINLIKSIEKTAEQESDDPFLIAMAERARAVQESFEDRQTSTADALTDLLSEVERNEKRKKEQATRGLDALSYFVLCKLTDDGIPDPEETSKRVAAALAEFPNWRTSETELREARKKVTFAIVRAEDDIEKATGTVDALFNLLQKSFRT